MPALLGNRALFRFEVEGCSKTLRVVRFRGQEAVSTPYEFRVEVAVDDVLSDSLIGKPALLTIDGIVAARHIHGCVVRSEYIGDAPRCVLYELTVVPRVWQLSQRASCRIFQQMTTPDILSKVLVDAGVLKSQFRLDLGGSYTPRDYCVQYNETDLDFVHRLMEADGIYYSFEHSEALHVMVLTDRDGCIEPPDGAVELGWGAKDGAVQDRELVTRFRLSEAMRPNAVSLRDHNLAVPSRRLEASDGTGKNREIYEYPGSYQELGHRGPQQGGQQARLRLEALTAAGRRGYGTTDSPRLLAGCGFTLAGHRWPDHDGDYRILGVAHTGEQPQTLDNDSTEPFEYSVDFECMPAAVPYRAPRVTPRPTVRGVQTATVVGPKGEEIFVDNFGRVKVKFHWDRSEASDETSSCWVRVSQLWAGNGFGAVFLPWVGHEVLVDFIEGDPDRPIVVGRVYTGDNTPPYTLPDEKTKSVIKTESSPGGGGYNELRFEDHKGSEQVYLQAEKDLDVLVKNDATGKIGRDRTDTVGRNAKEKIEGWSSLEVVGDETEKVGGHKSVTVDGNLAEKVGGNRNEDVDGAMAVRVTGNVTESSGQNIVLDAAKHLTITTGENVNISAGKKTAVVVGEKMTIQCGAVMVTISGGAVSIKAPTVDITGSAVSIKAGKIDLN